MRICLLGEAQSIHVKRWAGWFASRGDDVALVTLGLDSIPDVRIVRLPYADRGASAFLRKTVAIRRLVRELDPDLVHAHQAVGFGLWGALSGRHPYVVSAWGSDVLVRPHESMAQNLILRYVLRKADFCIPVAAHLAHRLRRYGLRSDFETIPMGVDLRRYPPIAYESDRRPFRFVSTRSLEPIYDIPTLLRASRLILAADPRIEGRILGGGSLRADLEWFAREQGILGRLRFDGPVSPDGTMDALANARIYISTSRSDGTSVSLLEAMSRGCFPIATDIPANREWITDGANGSLFPVGDAKALADRVLEWMANDAALDLAGKTNIKLIRERGDLDANLSRVRAIYERLVAVGGPKSDRRVLADEPPVDLRIPRP